jgi:hypothetical protein
MKILLISPCHKEFGGWFRTDNIYANLSFSGFSCKFLYNPKYTKNLILKLLIGLRNCLYIYRYNRVYVFEIVHPETLLPALLALIIGKKVLVDVGDEWLDSPTYHKSLWITRWIIKFLDTKVIKLFPITVTSGYLVDKYKRGIKLINGVNLHEFTPIPRVLARRMMNVSPNAKIVLALGNTFDGPRTTLLRDAFARLLVLDSEVILVWKQVKRSELDLYIGICDLILFPTGDAPNEKACFPIRIGSYLNGERVIATDLSETEWHMTLRPYNCTLEGNSEQLAELMYEFFHNEHFRSIIERNVLKAKDALTWEVQIGKLSKFFGNT